MPVPVPAPAPDWRWLLFLLALTFPLTAGDWRTLVSPGRLATPHAEFAGDCDQCHLVFDGVPNEKCLDCHDALGARIQAGEGFHWMVKGQPCIDCHTDHHGADGAQTEPEALAAFDHETTGFVLAGAHAEAKCETCHEKPIGQMEAVCIECHAEKDPHESALGPGCDSCHVTTAWDEELKPLAAHLTAMDGGHTGLGCADCHHQGEHLAQSVPCAACHEEAHGGTTSPCGACHEVAGWKPASFDHGPCTCTFAGPHQTVACLDCHPDFVFTSTPTLCSGCHSSDRPHEPLGECSLCHEATSWKDNQFDHNTRAKFAIDGQHLEVDCAACHSMDGTFRGVPTSCEGCHAARGQEAHGDFGPCATCHTTEHAGFSPSSFDHATTGFPLTGQHQALRCLDCHPDKVQGYSP